MTFDRRADSMDPKVKQALKRIKDDLKLLLVDAQNRVYQVEMMDFASPQDQRRETKLSYASRGITRMQDLLNDVEEGFEEAAELE